MSVSYWYQPNRMVMVAATNKMRRAESSNYSHNTLQYDLILGIFLSLIPKKTYLRLMSLGSPMIPVLESVDRHLRSPSCIPTFSRIVKLSLFSPSLSGTFRCSFLKSKLSSSGLSLYMWETDSSSVLLYS